MNNFLGTATILKGSATTIAAFEFTSAGPYDAPTDTPPYSTNVQPRHNNKANFLFGDGHVETLNPSDPTYLPSATSLPLYWNNATG